MLLTLTGGRYAGTKQLYFTVKPQATAFSKVKAGKKKMTLKWKKKSQISGYEVWYSTSKNMKKGVKKVVIKKAKTTSAVCKKLKSGKKYFVKIRTYKTVKQKNKSIKIVSNFSKVKSVKIVFFHKKRYNNRKRERKWRKENETDYYNGTSADSA